ncbi:MAG: TetR/AcrR family transcriptional regulator [Cellvibrionaceae bacterium]
MAASTSPPKPRLQNDSTRYHHGDLKASLIQAAGAILQRDGADALSLRAIAQEVGVSHTAPYSHFKNKKELIRAVIDRGFESLAEAMQSAADQSPRSRDNLALTYGAAYLEFAISNPELYRLMLGQVESRGLKKPSSREFFSSEERALKDPFFLLENAFEKFVDDSSEVKNKALGAWALVHGMAALLIEGYITVPDGMELRHFLASVTPS